ncbi:RodZ domain-containing protein [Hydrogenophaga sp.]|uniref:RodZ domain-containing protein n=1 Tax=Hydrogenophaga sp. TaxID=1904254 RepID=UPI002FCB9EB2
MSEAMTHPGSETSAETISRPIRLKDAREAAGLHIAALAAALKVPVKKLEALEAGRYDELPDLTFARALASSACRQLRVDPAPILQQIPQGALLKLGHVGQTLNAPFNSGHDEAPFNPLSWLSRPALLAAIALLLGALVIVFLPKAENPPAPSSATETISEPAPAVGPVAAQEPGSQDVAGPATTDPAVDPAATPGGTTTAPPEASASTQSPEVAVNPVTSPEVVAAPQSASLLSIAATGESWVEVVNGSGTVVAKRLLQSGDVIDFSAAPPYTVVLGKVDAAQVSVRGKSFDTSPFARNNVARFEVK